MKQMGNAKRTTKRWKILVVWSNGDEEYVAQGNYDAVFTSREKAEETAELAKMGMDNYQSISVVRA